MKRLFVLAIAAVVGCVALSANAQTSSLPDVLTRISNGASNGLIKRSLAYQLAVEKMHADDRVACVGMGNRECLRMIQLHSIQGPDTSGLPPLPDFVALRKQATNAVQYWVSEHPGQKDAAKRLYVAWLTMVDAMASYTGDPLTFQDTDAYVAYRSAANEFAADSVINQAP